MRFLEQKDNPFLVESYQFARMIITNALWSMEYFGDVSDEKIINEWMQLQFADRHLQALIARLVPSNPLDRVLVGHVLEMMK